MTVLATNSPRKIASVVDFGLEMHVLEQLVHVIPILHHEDVALVENEELDRSQEIVIRFGIAVHADRRTNAWSVQ